MEETVDGHTQSKALASCAQTKGHARGVTARLSRCPAMSSSKLRLRLSGSVVDEQEIQSAARDLYAPD